MKHFLAPYAELGAGGFTLPSFNHEKRIPVHRLLVISQHLYRKSQFSDSGKDIYPEALRTRPGQLQIFTLGSCARAVFTHPALIHEQQEGLLMASQKSSPFELQQFGVGLPAELFSVFRLVEFFLKVDNGNLLVFAEKFTAFGN